MKSPVKGRVVKYEVEQKFRLSEDSQVEETLQVWGTPFGTPFEQRDLYLTHPCRNFGETDESLRIRYVGNHAFVTYKGPKIDTTTKTRHEIELPLSEDPEEVTGFISMLEALGFGSFIEIRKMRRKSHVLWQGQTVEAVLDEVAALGRFVELELAAGAAEVDVAKSCLADLARELGLTDNERRSYLELLLELNQ